MLRGAHDGHEHHGLKGCHQTRSGRAKTTSPKRAGAWRASCRSAAAAHHATPIACMSSRSSSLRRCALLIETRQQLLL